MADLQIPNPSITSGAFTSMLAFSAGTDIITAISGHPIGGVGGGGGTPTEGYWRPLYNDNTGDLSWIWSIESTANAPAPANIAGPQGPSGDPGISDITFEAVQEAGHENGGTKVTFLFGPDGTQSSAFNIWNGNDGGAAGALDIAGLNGIIATKTGSTYQVSFSGAGGDKNALYGWNAYSKAWEEIQEGSTINLLEGTGIKITENGINYTIGVSADYALKSYVNEASANAYNEAVAQIPDVTNFITKDADNLTYYYKKTETSAASALATEFAKYVIKPDSSLVNNYLVLRTDNAGNVSGWCDFNDQCYSKGESDRTFVATANIDTTTLSGNGKSSSTKLGVNTSAIPTKDWLDDNYLPLSGGIVSGSTYFSAANGQNMIAVASAATLIGASRQTSANFGINNTAIGTTWVGVNGDGSNRGFLKYINGGNVGDLNGQGVQVEFGGGNGGEMLLKTSTSDPNTTTKVVNVPQSGYNSMIDFDATNGPNYMLRKLSDGRFDIGACVINVTSIPTATEPNTYYFVYDIV